LPRHPDAVATTWSLSFERVKQKNPAAAELLLLCAFLSPDAIPEELITRGAAHVTPSLQALASSVLLLNEAISTLHAYSLLRRDPATRMLSLHRLVQAVLQDALEETDRRSWAKRVMLAVNAAFPHPEHGTWPQCERLLPHALLAAHSIETHQIMSEEAGRLLHEMATYLMDRVRYSEASSLFQRALRVREQFLGPEHPQVASTLNNLALLYDAQGKYAEAEPVRSVHAKPWQHGGCVARQTILITPFLMLGAIPNLRNGPQTAVLPTGASGLQSVKRGTWEHLCKSDAGRQLAGKERKQNRYGGYGYQNREKTKSVR